MQFSYLKMLKKGVRGAVLFGLPMLVSTFVAQYPEWAQLSIGSSLLMLENFVTEKLK